MSRVYSVSNFLPQTARTSFPCWWLLLLTALLPTSAADQPARHLGLQEAIEAALLNNRSLQIERINPEIARSTLLVARGFYDPIFLTDVRWENATTPAELDPFTGLQTPARETRTDNVTAGVTGFLPTGLSYSLTGGYNYQEGTRDFAEFESYIVEAGIFLQQPLLKNFLIDQPRFVIRVNRGNLTISELGVEFVASSVINLTRQGYYDLAYAWEALAVQHELLATREQFLRGIQRQIEVGSLTLLEEKLAQAQRSRIATDLISASNLVNLAANNLRTLMGVTATNWADAFHIPTDALTIAWDTFDQQQSWRTGLINRADLLQLRAQADNAELAVKFRRNQLLPSLDLVGSYGRQGVSFSQPFPPISPAASSSEAFAQLRRGDAPRDLIGVVFSIPLGRRAERGEYRASQHLEEQARLFVKQQEELVLREISDAVHNARSSLERAESARRTIGFAEQALAAEEQKLRGGASNIFVVLQLQADLAAARLAELEAKRDHNKAVSQLRHAEGTLLDATRMVVEFD